MLWISEDTANRLLSATGYTLGGLRRVTEALGGDEMINLPAQTLGHTPLSLRTIDVDQADWYNLLRGLSRGCLSRMTIRRKIEAVFFQGR